MAEKYESLRVTNPGAAERFLSGLFRPKGDFNIALVDEVSATTMSSAPMFTQLQQELISRASGPSPQVPEIAKAINETVCSIRKNNQARCEQRVDTALRHLYGQEMVGGVIDGLKADRRCLLGPVGAIKASCSQGRRLTCSLVVIGLHMGITSTHWAL